MGLFIDGTKEVVSRLLLVDVLDQKRPRGVAHGALLRQNLRRAQDVKTHPPFNSLGTTVL
jgi:hypothetical protein